MLIAEGYCLLATPATTGFRQAPLAGGSRVNTAVRSWGEPGRTRLVGEPRPVPFAVVGAAGFNDTVLTVSSRARDSILSDGRPLGLANRMGFPTTMIDALIATRAVRAFFPQRRTVRAGSVHFLGLSLVQVTLWLAGGRVILIEAIESLTQLVEQFAGPPGAPFAQCLIYAG